MGEWGLAPTTESKRSNYKYATKFGLNEVSNMQWFLDWWNGVGELKYGILIQILYCVAIPSTFLIILQTIMMFVGGGHDTDLGGDIGGHSDTSGHSADGSHSTHHGMSDFGVASLFTLQGISSFLCMFGWTGALLLSSGVFPFLALPIAVIVGFFTMYGIAQFIRYSAKLTQDGTFNTDSLLGSRATVYMNIPPQGRGHGKVTIQTSERELEYDAVTEKDEALIRDTQVKVVNILGGDVLVVSALDN
jgi:membrane protein implicated in regulation of membrane protease activity